MKGKQLIWFAAAALWTALATPLQLAAQQQTRYTVTDLGTLGGTFSWATGINNNGAVSGFSNVLGDIDQHGFFWRDGVMNDLGTLGGPNSGVGFWGRRPNERGQLAGGAQTSTPDPAGEDFCALDNNFGNEPPAAFQCLPFVWQNSVMTPLPTLEINGLASQINDSGLVVGEVDGMPDCSPPGTFHPRPVLWRNGVLHELPLLAGTLYGGPNAVNDKGQSVGVLVSDCAASVASATLWEGETVTYLGSLGGQQFDEAVSINNQGQVVGFASLPGNAVWHAFFWTKRDGIKDLGTLPGDVLSFAAGINDQSQIVGTSFDANGNPRAFIGRNGVMTDLNTLVSVDSPLYLLFGFDINARGQIVGQAFDTITQELHAFLATPSNAEVAAGSAAAAALGATSQRPNMLLPENVRKLLRQRLQFGRFNAPLAQPK